jgi:hypothetical protein
MGRIEIVYRRAFHTKTGDPAHTRAVTWRTDRRAETPQVQFAPASANPDFMSDASTVQAKAGSLDI